ncbi:MAG TPA: hypothetical protein VEC13_01005 [Candidatus Paceibacterota bacterium]|nr:hypothetical protein [Candidatus Paceibacterota bacterium]
MHSPRQEHTHLNNPPTAENADHYEVARKAERVLRDIRIPQGSMLTETEIINTIKEKFKDSGIQNVTNLEVSRPDKKGNRSWSVRGKIDTGMNGGVNFYHEFQGLEPLAE